MTARGLISQTQIEDLRERVAGAMRVAADALLETDADAGDGKRRIRPDLWPSADFRDVGILGDLAEMPARGDDQGDGFHGETVPRKFVDVVADVMDRRMACDDSIVVMGEDVHRLKGGTNGATRGLAQRYPDRCLGTPISENAFVGLAGGIALDGRYKPVVEFMYPDFMWVAADQVFNQIGKVRRMFGGDDAVLLVLRTKVAMGTGYGSQHSMDPAGIFAICPGWRIVAPSNPCDYVGLMNAALCCKDPVLVIEHVDLYNATAPAPRDDLDFVLPVGRAALRRTGSAVTVIAYLSMVQHAMEALDRMQMAADLIDLRWLDRASLDWDTVGASVRKTNNVLIVEQGARGTSYGGWLADEIQRRYFDWLDQPVQRVTGGMAAPSISKVLERAAAARTDEVVEGLREILRNKGEGLMATMVCMPAVSANAPDAVLAEWTVKEGDSVRAGDSLGGIETEKAVVDLEAEHDGVVGRLLVAPGTRVAVGAPVALLLREGETPQDIAQAAERAHAAARSSGTASAAPPDEGGNAGAGEMGVPGEPRRFASPVARRLAADAGLPLAGLAGSGPHGRVIKRDVEHALARAAVRDAPLKGSAGESAFDLVPHGAMRTTIARRLSESKRTVPHFYLRGQCRADALLGLRDQLKASRAGPRFHQRPGGARSGLRPARRCRK